MPRKAKRKTKVSSKPCALRQAIEQAKGGQSPEHNALAQAIKNSPDAQAVGRELNQLAAQRGGAGALWAARKRHPALPSHLLPPLP